MKEVIEVEVVKEIINRFISHSRSTATDHDDTLYRILDYIDETLEESQ
jgi:hypothetical protein